MISVLDKKKLPTANEIVYIKDDKVTVFINSIHITVILWES